MANHIKNSIIEKLETKYGRLKRVGDGNSLYLIETSDVFVYFRYSKITQASKLVKKAFYGLRKEDILLMQNKKSFICFITDDVEKDIVIPFQQFENYFSNCEPAKDGQFKVLSFFKPTGVELYFANIGKFNSESYLGLNTLFNLQTNKLKVPLLTHSNIQSLVASIGIKKGFDIWFPPNDKIKIDTNIVDFSRVRNCLPDYGKEINHIISEIDVIWLKNTNPISFYEVEHSTPIYSGLLRFNDVLLTLPKIDNFNIVAHNDRENKFGREIQRPTFKQNKLIDKVTFLDYENIFNWYFNLNSKIYEPK
jgi:hypothetical protein